MQSYNRPVDFRDKSTGKIEREVAQIGDIPIMEKATITVPKGKRRSLRRYLQETHLVFFENSEFLSTTTTFNIRAKDKPGFLDMERTIEKFRFIAV